MHFAFMWQEEQKRNGQIFVDLHFVCMLHFWIVLFFHKKKKEKKQTNVCAFALCVYRMHFWILTANTSLREQTHDQQIAAITHVCPEVAFASSQPKCEHLHHAKIVSVSSTKISAICFFCPGRTRWWTCLHSVPLLWCTTCPPQCRMSSVCRTSGEVTRTNGRRGSGDEGQVLSEGGLRDPEMAIRDSTSLLHLVGR